MSKLRALWTPEQVDALNEYQRVGWMHPYTCANRDKDHKDHGEGDHGVLVATPEGWVCRDCQYTQNWAHDWTARPLSSEIQRLHDQIRNYNSPEASDETE